MVHAHYTLASVSLFSTDLKWAMNIQHTHLGSHILFDAAASLNAMQAIDMVVHNESSDTATITGTQHILALMYIVRFCLYELATCKIILLLQFSRRQHTSQSNSHQLLWCHDTYSLSFPTCNSLCTQTMNFSLLCHRNPWSCFGTFR